MRNDPVMANLFNVRVYGILIDQEKGLLVSDEFIRGDYITKFPGGGLEYGEGTRDCLKRECREEMNLEVLVTDHLYTTDFFQMSAFNPEHQIISIYYAFEPLGPLTVPLKTKPFDFDAAQMKIYEKTGETETFRFIPLGSVSPDCVTLPIDKVVAGMIASKR